MLKNQQKIDVVLSKKIRANLKPPKEKKKKLKFAFEMLVKKAICGSKSGCTEKSIALWIKRRNHVDFKIINKILKRVLKRLLQAKIIYVHQRKPVKYKLTSNGKQLKQGQKRGACVDKKKEKNTQKKNKSKNKPLMLKRF